MEIRDRFRSRNVRALCGFVGWAVSIAVTSWTASRPLLGSAAIILAAIFPVYLFWPELKRLRITYPKNHQMDSPGWLYIIGIGSLGLVLFAFANLYLSVHNRPSVLSADEWSQQFIHGKYFRIVDLVDANNVIEHRTFEDCYIYGPAVLYGTEHSTIINNHFASSPEHVFLVVAPQSLGGPQTGIIVLKDCQFRNCHIFNISIAGVEKDIDVWKKGNLLVSPTQQ